MSFNSPDKLAFAYKLFRHVHKPIRLVVFFTIVIATYFGDSIVAVAASNPSEYISELSQYKSQHDSQRELPVLTRSIIQQPGDVVATALTEAPVKKLPLEKPAIENVALDTVNHTLKCQQMSSYAYERHPTSDELFIVSQLAYGKEMLSDELFAYQEGAVHYLPIQVLADLLLIPIDMADDTASLTGWYLNPEKKIELNQGLLRYWANKGPCELAAGRVFFDEWDLYLDVKLIESMFGLAIAFDEPRQQFTIAISDDIPLSLLLARQKKFAAFEAVQKRRLAQKVMVVESQNAMVGDLVGHIELGVDSQHHSTVQKTSDNGFVQLRSDLGLHNAYVGYSWSDSYQHLNAYLEKYQEDSWIKHYRVGSVNSDSLPLVSDSASGVGVNITAGDGFTDDFRSIVVEGEVEPNWDVELYRNNSLISMQKVGAEARYRFTDVPFYIGTNQYQLKFFGPNGETRTESFNKVLDNSSLEQGNIGMSFGAMVQDDDEALAQYYVHANLAVTDNITSGLSLINQEDADGNWQFIPKININFLGEQNLLQLNLAHSGEGYAIGTVIQGGSERLDWSADWQLFDDFTSWDNPQSQLLQEANVSLNANLDNSSLNLSFSGRWTEYVFSGEYLQLNMRLSGQLGRFSYSNDIRWQSSHSYETVTDQISISGKISNWYVRSYLDIDIVPDAEINRWAINANTAINDDFNYQAEVIFQAQTDAPHSIRNTISYLFEQSSLRFSMQNYSDGNWSAQINWSTSFLWQPKSGQLMLDRNSYLNTGAVSIKAFQDDNVNGLYDEGEQLVEGLSFSGHRNSANTTDDNGELFVTHLQTTRAQSLKLNDSSLSDPFLVAAVDEISVEPHAGYIEQILFPVMYTAEMEGSVLTASGNPAKRVAVVLKSKSSDRQYTASVEFDGVFIFDRIVPGDYQLLIGDELSFEVTLEPGAFVDFGQINLT